MPAIDLARLKTQAARLADNFSNHMAFLSELHAMLDFYTNRTMRASQVARRLSLPTYHTPAPVLRQIERELAPVAERLPGKGVLLAVELWKDGSLESRLLAARLIGMIPPADATTLLARLPDWLAQTTDKEIRQALLTDSLARIRREIPEAFFLLLEEWLKSPRAAWQIWGMQALIPLLNDPGFQNLPAVLRILRPAVQAAGPTTQLELQACLVALERVSLTETTVFLRGLLSDHPPSMLLRTLRRVLPAFSPRLQTAMRDMLRSIHE
ncbi:MAG: hypothetical protein HY781_05730 [Chloroflexi bacterium]|nr:hypothetical protein [Chloroflexota bacterium]